MHLQHMQMHVDVDEFISVFLLQLEFATNSGDNVHVCDKKIKETATRHSG